MMRKSISLFLLSVSLLFVSSCKKEVPIEGIVGEVAKRYYEYLLDGKYEEFVDCHYQTDSIPASYREQLVANAKMFMSQMKEEHRGIDSVSVQRVVVDSLKTSADAFLMLYFHDGIAEEVVLPMVSKDAVWLMR